MRKYQSFLLMNGLGISGDYSYSMNEKWDYYYYIAQVIFPMVVNLFDDSLEVVSPQYKQINFIFLFNITTVTTILYIYIYVCMYVYVYLPCYSILRIREFNKPQQRNHLIIFDRLSALD